uniref:GEO10024p1 n=1 Tax=Drosophila melanogaster TaxID=7227 RepID=A8WH76_DROME|eukprot:NP_001162726.1 inaF-B [Drosophila melanogaster]
MSGPSALMANLADVVKEAKDEEIPMPKSNDFFESKTFRLLTLLLYMGGVSGMGLTLAVYYLFIWDSRMPPLPVFKHTHPIG